MRTAGDGRGTRLLLPLATSALFSGSYVAGKLVADELSPLDATLARYAVALAALAALLPRFGIASLRLAPRDVPVVAFLGLTGIVGYHGLFFAALRHTSAGNTAIINTLCPVLTAAAAAVLLGERLGARAYAGVGIACAGAILLVSGADPARLAGLALNPGDLLMLGAVACWVAYSLALRRMLARRSGFGVTFHATLAGVSMLAAATAVAGGWQGFAGMSLPTFGAIVYMGAFASGLGYLLYSFSVARLGPTRTSSVVYCTVPVLVAALALATLGEPITAVSLASIVLVLLGLRLVAS